MKEITIKSTQTMKPIDYAKMQLEVVTGQYVASVLVLRPNTENNEVVATVQLISLKLRNVLNYELMTRLFQVAYYMQADCINSSALSSLEEKELEEDLTEKELKEKALREEMVEFYEEVASLFSEEEIAFCKNDTFVNMLAGAITGDFSVCIRNGSSMNSMLAILGREHTHNEIKECATAYCLSLTGYTDQLYNGYHLNCNAQLAREIEHRYYKGRKLTKSGTVKKEYDKDGKVIRKEIALAIIEDLQKKAQAVATDNNVEACTVESK